MQKTLLLAALATLVPCANAAFAQDQAGSVIGSTELAPPEEALQEVDLPGPASIVIPKLTAVSLEILDDLSSDES
jgi:hypothetical protein